MRRFKSVTFIVVLILIFAMLLSACRNQNNSVVSSDIISSEITSSDIASSEPEKEEEPESSKPENSSNPETSSKPKVSSKPTTSQNNTSSNFLSNITITSPFPRPQKEQEVSSELEDDDYWYDPDLTSSQESEAKKHEKLIRGVWNFEYDLTPSLLASGYDIKEPMVMTHCYVFNDSRYRLTVFNKREYYDKLHTYLLPDVEKQLRAQLKANKITESQFVQVMGVSISKYANSILVQQINNIAYTSGNYFFRDDKLYMRDSDSDVLYECIYSFIDDNTLVITNNGQSITVRRSIEENTVTSE